MKPLVARIRSSAFAKSLAVVAGGAALAQAVSFVFSPLLTRVYDADALGTLGVYNAVVAILLPVSTMGFANAIPMPERISDAIVLSRASVFSSASVAVAVIGLVGFFGGYAARLLEISHTPGILWLVAPAVLLVGLQQTSQHWLIRSESFGRMATVATVHAIALGAGKLFVGLRSPSGMAIVLVTALGHALSSFLMWSAVRRTRSQDVHQISRKQFREALRKYRDFPLLRTPRMLINSLASNAPVLLISAIFGPTPAGYYAIANRALMLPVVLISQSVAKTIVPRLSKLTQIGQPLRPFIAKVTVLLVIVGIVPFGAVAGWAPAIFGVVFGKEWVAAGDYARWMVPWLFFAFISVPCVQSLPFTRQQGFLLLWEITGMVAKLASVLLSASITHEAVEAVKAFSIVAGLWYGVLMWHSFRVSCSASRLREL